MTVVMQSSWRRCTKCLGLWYAANGTDRNHCPAGGTHTMENFRPFVLLTSNGTTPPGYQSSWALCNKCHGFFLGSAQTSSCCPAGGTHDSDGVAGYLVAVATPPQQPNDGGWTGMPYEDGWSWCCNCQGLFFGSGVAAGRCPSPNAPGGQHNPTGSGNYALSYGPFPEMLNVIFQDPDNHTYRIASSPDGTLANLNLQEAPIFGTAQPQGQTGSIIGVTQSDRRFYFTAMANDGSNVVNLGSIGIDGSIGMPASTSTVQIGLPVTYPSSPAITYSNGMLYLFYRPFYNGQAIGDTSVLPVTPDPNGGPGFTTGQHVNWDNDQYSGGRITATTTGRGTSTAPYCGYSKPLYPNGGYTLEAVFYATNSTGSWAPHRYSLPADPNSNYYRLVTDTYYAQKDSGSSGCVFTLPNGNLGLGFTASDNLNPSQVYYVDTGGTAGVQPAGGTGTDKIFASTEPIFMTAADNSCVYVACVNPAGGNTIQGFTVFRLSADLTRQLEPALQVNPHTPLTVSLLCCFQGGMPAPQGQ